MIKHTLRDSFGNEVPPAPKDYLQRPAKRTRKPKAKYDGLKPGPQFRTQGFYVEGRHFPGLCTSDMDHASAFAARLAEEYGRQVNIMTCLIPGAAMLHFAYFPSNSMEAENRLARPDRFGYVMTCNGKTTFGV